MAEVLERLAQQVRDATAARRALRLRGGGSKDFYGGEGGGEALELGGYSGIVSYEPTELVVTARCGTRLADLEAELATHGQILAFEPPHFGAAATLGGCVAAGLSGPRRASAGAVRDFVLGARLLDGRGKALSFGGQVMKNVAGYDVSRLLAGSLGTLGAILEVSLKVLPRPAVEKTRRLEMPEPRALEALNQWAGKPLPISASAWHDGELALRVSGAPSAVDAACKKLGGESMDDARAQTFWDDVREQRATFFVSDQPLWRVALPSSAPPLGLPGAQLIEWGGGLRWIASSIDARTLRESASRAGGHATLFRARDKSAGVFTPLAPVALRLHRELKAGFDPAGIFNRGRLYPEF
jgi:glycolate oxidase FAD binding subunit